MWWRSLLAFYAMLPAAATLFFVIFWRWFDYWRAHRTQIGIVVVATFTVAGLVIVVARDWTFAGQVDLPVVVELVGAVVLAVTTAFGTVADRQIGLRVRTFTPFFEQKGHLELKTTGAYGVVRHPIYAAGIGFQLGAFLVTGYPGILVSCAVFGGGAMWFTRKEEERLMQLLDDPTEYERYRRRVPALVPKLG